MGSVAQAVVEFDEAVQAPWRPPLAGGAGRQGRLRAVPDLLHDPAPLARGAGRSAVGAAAHRGHPAAARVRRPHPAGSTTPRRPAPYRAGGDPRVAPALRLTRRARRLGVVLGLAVGVALGSWVGSVVAGGQDGGLRLAGESSVVVQQGDTLWSIAGAVADEGDDLRAVIAEIRALNGLPDATLVPGQLLVLP
ncbi:LysM peptidoglycan-binding domain-containing protein [Blastococcus goldschmidtiae]|uniref:LysM peptidoglycan-binding domain-containing protein n=1 Tax=Blastococcus goldschmidtiae TaxID=3075546 RepID=A0ABU2K8L7_9ACTN|nr:LysM peptidoglycan-binding domain-containing protein [Blastococcus sp. DSM 46792]MDT0276535.1 LysM peptidoglycan-binding domain-containing protein [Blastococcus sp. DSM 46792]